MSRLTRGPSSRFPLRGCHPLWPAFPDGSGTKDKGHWPGPLSLATTRGVSSALLAQSAMLMSFPPATEMFQFAGFASRTYEFSTGYPLPGGLPHSEIPGSTIARISPGLFAACHVLHRLSVPRHPPDALSLRLSATPNGKDHFRWNASSTKADSLVIRRGKLSSQKTLCAEFATHRPLGLRGTPSASVTQLASLRFAINNALRQPIRDTPKANSLLLPRFGGSAPRSELSAFAPRLSAFARQTPVGAIRSALPRDESSAFIGGGGERVRTDDLRLAKPALSQLSYTPVPRSPSPEDRYQSSDTRKLVRLGRRRPTAVPRRFRYPISVF